MELEFADGHQSKSADLVESAVTAAEQSGRDEQGTHRSSHLPLELPPLPECAQAGRVSDHDKPQELADNAPYTVLHGKFSPSNQNSFVYVDIKVRKL
jgi:hypothetical protein